MENFSAEHLLIVFALTTFAGLATGIGGAIGFFVRRTNTRLLTFFLGLSAGVMIFISFVEMFASAQRDLAEIFGHVRGGLFALGAFFGGIGVAMLIDRLVPEESNPHETHGAEELDAPARVVPAGEMRRTGFLFMLAIGIHNFPEGMATFAAGLDGLTLGVPIAVAVALHNIPEGLAISVPVYSATGSRKKAFFYSFAAGVGGPGGGPVGEGLLFPFLFSAPLAVPFSAGGGGPGFLFFFWHFPPCGGGGDPPPFCWRIVLGMLLMGCVLAVF